MRLRLLFEFYLQVSASQQRIPGGAKRYLAVKTSNLWEKKKHDQDGQLVAILSTGYLESARKRLWGSQFQNLRIRFPCKIGVEHEWRRPEKIAEIKRLRRIIAKTSMHIYLPSSYSNNLAHIFSHTFISS